MQATPPRYRKQMIAVLFAAIILLFGASFYAMLTDFSLTVYPKRTPPAAAPSDNTGMGFALSEEKTGALGRMMARLQSEPDNAALLTDIAEIFMQAEEWARAATFLQRAVAADPQSTDAYFMLGLCYYNDNNYQEAAATLEKLLDIKEDPSAMYNLALLYKHFLNKPDATAAFLEKIRDFPGVDPILSEKAQKELQE